MDQNLETLRAALIERYEVERPIGSGGMATVYLARDLKHDRRVAIKVMSPELAATIGAERFTREVRIAAKLSHPNVLGVFDSGEANGLLFYVMPFVEGETLREKLLRERQLSIDEAIQITCEVAEALGHAHAQRIVHRDVKPENILLQRGHAMVADFGIARLAEETAEKLTRTGMAVGTATYMSPEQAGGEPTDGRSDIYALGCVLYEMLVGQPPFTGPNAMAIMSQHNMATVPEVRVMRQSVPEELELVIRRAMEKTPADRFQTMEEFKQAVLGEIPATTIVPKYTARYRVPGARKERPVAAKWMLAMIPAAAIVAIAAYTLAARKHSAAPDANKIAVLYFTDETGGALEHVADGLTESLIDRLSDVAGLSVVPANGVRALRGKPVSGDSARARFGVGTLVKGSVTREGSQAKVTISVVDAASDASYDRKSISVDTAQIASLQGMVADEVAGFLREAVGTEISLKSDRGQTSSTAAWSLAERAAKLRRNADSLLGVKARDAALAALASADSLLVVAQREDSKWPKLPAMRASNALMKAQLMGRKSPEQLAALDSGFAYANAALRINSSDANALEAKGRLQYASYQIDPLANTRMLDTAEATLIEAVKANRRQAGAWVALSNLYYSKPNIADANRAAQKAYEADAYLASANGILRRLFTTSHDLENYPEALQWCDQGRRRFPADPYFVECRLWMYTTPGQQPNIDSAWAYQKQFMEMTTPAGRAYADKYGRIIVAGALARTGRDADSARHVLASARATPAIDPERDLLAYEAVVRTMLGDYDEAVDLLQSYGSIHPDHLKGFVTRVGPWWRDIQSNGRFKRLLATVK
jgi:TolB-like protein/tRNA A-37 threonylcarbamoyl transferase component Bud32/tetratricopeptide (TPR) repeat protein